MMPFIVAEICVTWRDGHRPGIDQRPMSAVFEELIETNRQRGYRLHVFNFAQLVAPDPDGQTVMTETLLAVFERMEAAR